MAAQDDGADATPEERRAMFRVVAGAPSDSEVVALAMVIAAAAGESGDAPGRTDRWSAPTTQHRRPLEPGPGAWRATYWPR